MYRRLKITSIQCITTLLIIVVIIPLQVDNYTLWDMASLTKVLMTTTAVMTFYQRGELSLDWSA